MDLNDVIKNSFSHRQCLIKLNWNITGTNYSKLKKIIEENDIDITHFLPPSKFGGKLEKIPMNEILTENSLYGRGHLKRRIIKEKLIKYECVLCGNDGNWMGKKISLILDHINGINNDNRIENLRFVCPNCNATLDTFCGKNIKNSVYNREKKKCICGNEITTNANLCVVCSKKKMRKVERPSINILMNEIQENGYSATGRKYGVSDNAIRKWLKNSEPDRIQTCD